MQQFINHNGNYFTFDQPLVMPNNRAFRYGDGLFETIRIARSHPQFLKEHLQRLYKGMSVFKMKANPLFNESFFEQAILELAQKNGITTDGRVRLTIYRNEGGYYAPENNEVSYLLEASSLDEIDFSLNTKGFTVDLFTEYKKPMSSLSSLKSANSAIYVLAGIHKNQNALDECVLMNDNGNVTEAISHNIFAVKNGVLYTPPVTDGCIDGIMREKIILIAQQNRIAVYENSIMQNVLLGADEFFLTNVITGIRWVVAYKQKRYFNSTSKKLVEKLNELIV